MKYQIRIAPIAYRDIEAIGSYIAKDKPNISVKVVNKLFNAFDLLQENPNIGGSVHKRFNIETEFLFLVVTPYIVFYKIEKEFVSIYRILDGRSDYLTILGLHLGSSFTE